ncbi:MAG: Na/Pi cotransporter family protein [Oscillospiraceae bacterium]|nr:Na/Pi cotransporter family protein [Oscillospiraceae bacterium]
MSIADAFSLFGGLALFLYGMHMMSDGLEAAAGEKMKKILEKLTSSTIKGVFVGALITAIIQSSSATTVMLVGFVNSGLMALENTVGVIMGANIGTTMTGILLSVGIGDIAPIIAFVGVALIMFSKDDKKNKIGVIIAGLGILFLGMNMMSDAMRGMRDSQTFINLITTLKNPILGVLVGTVFTAIIQSSSASVGILQALAMAGLVTLDTGIYVMFGFAIGTCVTAVIASIGANANAKRVTIIHLAFNVIGTVVFVIICQFLPFVGFVESIFHSPEAQIANAFLIFKVVTTIMLVPFTKQLVAFSKIVVKDAAEAEKRPSIGERAVSISGYHVGASAIAIGLIREEVNYMYDIAKRNVALSFDAVINNTPEFDKEIRRNEDELDELNADISQYISSILGSVPQTDADVVSGYFRIVGNIERIGDHATNFADYTKFFLNTNQTLSDRATGEVVEMKKTALSAMSLLEGDRRDDAATMLTSVARAEQEIDDMTDAYRTAQMDRMRTTTCSPEASVVYAEMLTDFERIGDHLLNIAEEFAKMYPTKKIEA